MPAQSGGGGGGGGREPEQLEIILTPFEDSPIWRGDGPLAVVPLRGDQGVHLRGRDELEALAMALKSIPVEFHRFESKGKSEIYLPSPLLVIHVVCGNIDLVHLKDVGSETRLILRCYRSQGEWEVVASKAKG